MDRYGLTPDFMTVTERALDPGNTFEAVPCRA
jgi:hypothetical protein